MNRRSHTEDSIYERAAFDSPANQKSRSNKKRQAIINTWQQPVWPNLTKILFISMIALSVAMAMVEVKNALLGTSFDFRRFLSNLSVTLLYVWGIYTVLLVFCCLMGSRVNKRSYYKRKAESGISDTQLYKQAGNSIVVGVLEKIFKNLLV